jgi:hypothetical protein
MSGLGSGNVAVLLKERRLEWRRRREGRFVLISPDSNSLYRSGVLPGLWLSEPTFWANDVPRLLAVLEEGMRSAGSR